MIRGAPNQSIGAQLLTAADGSGFVGPITVYITGDAGAQVIGSVNGGLCTHEGHGYHTYRPTAAETNFALIAFTFTGPGAIPETIQVQTLTPQQQVAADVIPGAPTLHPFTATNLITRALRSIGLQDAIESPSPEDLAEYLELLNEMMDEWSADECIIFTAAESVHDLQAGVASYTIGIGGTFNIPRPSQILGANLILDPSVVDPVQIGLVISTAVEEYQAITVKSIQGQPTGIFYGSEFVGGLASLTFWPVPETSRYDVVLYTPQLLTRFADLSTPYLFPRRTMRR